MDAHLIYTTHAHLKTLAKWSEWIYCGVGADIKTDVINKIINEYFEDSTLYFVTDRKESGQINKEDILQRINKEIEQKELFLWDINLKKIIEFNRIGVMRKGLISTSV
ncbi:hypothetical protein [Ferruginibacter sp.]